MTMFTAPLFVAAAACTLSVHAAPSVRRAAGCAQPKGSTLDWLCDEKMIDQAWESGWESGWSTTIADWQGTEPGMFSGDRVSAGQNGLSLEVQDNGAGWTDESLGKDTCACGHERFSTAIVVSNDKFGDGFFEAKISADKPTPFHGAFWLQSDQGEIDVLDFSHSMDKAQFTANFHCWGETDADAQDGGEGVEYDVVQGTSAVYGLHYSGDWIEFYQDGKVVGKLQNSCLKENKMQVIFSHETNPDYGGYNEPTQWSDAKYSDEMQATITVEYFRYWKNVAAATTTTAAAAETTTAAATKAPAPSATTAAAAETTTAAATKAPAPSATTAAAGERVCPVLKPTAALKYGTYYKGTKIASDVGIKEGGAAACSQMCVKATNCVYWSIHRNTGCTTYSAVQLSPPKFGKYFYEHGTCMAADVTMAPATTTMAQTVPATKAPAPAATTAAKIPAGCTKLDSVVSGVTGYYRGSKIRAVSAVKTFDGCVAECAKEATCVYFAIHDSQGCILMKSKGGFAKSGAYDAGMGECATVAATTAPTPAATTNAPATAAGPATLPTNCKVLKQFSAESGKRHAYQGKNYNDPITGLVNAKGLSKEACATKCASLPMCSYWLVHSSKGCIMKYWGLPRKQVKGTAYEAHGTCEPVLDAKCEQLGASLSGDGFAARREFKTIKEAATARTPGGCSQLCAKTDGCNYWIVHNTKGCFMHKKTKKGVLKPGWKKKGFMAHGVCNNYEAAWAR